jgi:hypothetical protein
MSYVQIPNLPAVASLSGAELFEGVQSGTSVKISLNQIAEAVRFGSVFTIPILVSQGGTGVTTLTGYVKGSGTTPFTASATIPNTDITGLGTMSTQNANSVAITGGSVTGITDITVSDGGTGVSTLTGYVKGSGTAPLTASATIPSSDITGLGTMSTQNANAVAITGGTINGTTIGATTRASVNATTLNANDASVISVSSASPALTVTQTGAGAAFLVEDETSPDTTPFIVTATGFVGIGTQFPGAAFNVYNATSTIAQITGDSFVSFNLSRASTDFGSSTLAFRKYRGTLAAPTAVTSTNTIGTTTYNAYDGASLINAAQIAGVVDTFVGADNLGGFLQFFTRPNGAAGVLTERLRIGSAGQFGIGGANYGTSGQTIVSGGSAAAPAWGVLPLSGGGLGVTTAPAAAAVLMGFATTATAAGTTTLTNTSSQYQLFTGVTTQTISLPVTTSAFSTGWTFHIVNNSTGNLTVNASSGALVCTVISGMTAMVTCISTAVTDATAWEFGFTDFGSVTGTGSVVLGTGPTITAGVYSGTVGASSPSTGAFTTVTASTSVLSSGTGGVGYSTGAGVAVTQLTSRTTAAPTTGVSKSGAVTLFTTTAVVGTYFSFTVPNTGIAVTDTVVVSVRGATNTYVAFVSAITAATSFQITMASVAGTASDTPIVNFTIIKGVSA